MKKRIPCSKSELIEYRKNGFSNKEIAEVLGISLATVYNYIGSNKGERTMNTDGLGAEQRANCAYKKRIGVVDQENSKDETMNETTIIELERMTLCGQYTIAEISDDGVKMVINPVMPNELSVVVQEIEAVQEKIRKLGKMGILK